MSFDTLSLIETLILDICFIDILRLRLLLSEVFFLFIGSVYLRLVWFFWTWTKPFKLKSRNIRRRYRDADFKLKVVFSENLKCCSFNSRLSIRKLVTVKTSLLFK